MYMHVQCTLFLICTSKSQRGMSEFLINACEEAKNGDITVKKQIRDIDIKFLNAVEISTQPL